MGIDTLILNGPTADLGEAALYRIDQFLLNGGSLFVLIDGYIQEIPSQQAMMAGAQPTWRENESNVLELLEHYGFDLGSELVLDEESFVSRQGGRRRQLYQAPVLGGRSISRDSVVTSGLEDVIVLNAISVTAEAGETLLWSSPKSWTVASPEEVGPWIDGLPNLDGGRQYPLAAIYEGELESFFEEPVALPLERLDASIESEAASPATIEAQPELGRGTFYPRSIEPGRILVVGSAALTTAQMLDSQSRTPNGTLLLNAVDYLNGAPGFAELRSKGLGVPRLNPISGVLSTTLRWANTILAPVIALLFGLVVWARRRTRQRRIRGIFAHEQQGVDR